MKTLFRSIFIAIIFTILSITCFTGWTMGKTDAPEEIWPLIKSNENVKRVYLTFDDGPSTNTIKILDILDQYQVKATFFVIGNEEPYAAASYREMIKRGHSIALHSYSHDYNLIYRSKNDFFKDLKRLELLLGNKYSIKTNFIRTPGGSGNKLFYQAATKPIIKDILSQLTNSGYVYVDWNVDSKDGISPYTSTYEIKRNVLNTSHDYKQAIILLHDINDMKSTVKALPAIIEGLKKDGFIFDTINDSTPKIQFN